MSLGKLSPEAGVALLGLGSALRGQDPAQAVFQARGVMEQKQLREKQEELQKMQEEFFKDPKYKDMAKIFGIEFAYKQRQSDMASEIEAQENQKFLDNVN